MSAIITFDKANRIIEVDTAVHPIVCTVQELINAIRDYEDEIVNMEIPKIANATGKDNLGGGTYTGITLTLLNWTIKFADHPGPDYVLSKVSDGNLLAVDGNGDSMLPFTPSTFTSILYSTAVSVALYDAGASSNPWSLPKVDNQVPGTMGGRVKDLEDELAKVKSDTALVPALI
jgi:hypothetical protein